MLLTSSTTRASRKRLAQRFATTRQTAGTKKRFGLTELTEEHWESMKAIGVPDAYGNLKSVDQRRRKAVAKELVMRLGVGSAVADSFAMPTQKGRLGPLADEISDAEDE